jgi:hypothetical protein
MSVFPRLFRLSRFWLFLSDGSSKTLQKNVLQNNRVDKFLQTKKNRRVEEVGPAHTAAALYFGLRQGLSFRGGPLRREQLVVEGGGGEALSASHAGCCSKVFTGEPGLPRLLLRGKAC